MEGPPGSSLAGPQTGRAVKHLAALRFHEVPAFMRELRQREEVEARPLEFLVWPARVPMKWSPPLVSIVQDRDAWIWIVPAERMKGRREHRVPLSGPRGPCWKKRRTNTATAVSSRA